jgi:hypothetical protein
MMYSITPQDQMSATLPSYDEWLSTWADQATLLMHRTRIATHGRRQRRCRSGQHLCGSMTGHLTADCTSARCCKDNRSYARCQSKKAMIVNPQQLAANGTSGAM